MGSPLKRTLLIPVDDSPNCHRAFNWYLRYVRLTNDNVIFLHVAEPHFSSALEGFTTDGCKEELHKVMEHIQKESKEILDHFDKQATSEKVAHSVLCVFSTSAGQAIMDAITEHNADLVIIGRRGTGVHKTITGSLCEFIINEVTVPVLIVPPKPTNELSQSL